MLRVRARGQATLPLKKTSSCCKAVNFRAVRPGAISNAAIDPKAYAQLSFPGCCSLPWPRLAGVPVTLAPKQHVAK